MASRACDELAPALLPQAHLMPLSCDLCVPKGTPCHSIKLSPVHTPMPVYMVFPLSWGIMSVIYCISNLALVAWFYFQLTATWCKFQPQYQSVSLVMSPTPHSVNFHHIRKVAFQRGLHPVLSPVSWLNLYTLPMSMWKLVWVFVDWSLVD